MSAVASKPSRRKSIAVEASSRSNQGNGGEVNPTNTHSVGGGSNGKGEIQKESSGSNGKTESTASHVVDGLAAAIGEHDSFFSTMLDMIPENLVLPAKEVPEAAYASKYMKNKKEEAPQQARKEESKSKKRARYAPENQKTVNERQQERALADKDEDEAEESIALELDEGNAAKAGDEEDVESDGGEQAQALMPEVLRKKTMNVGSMDALRERIAERIKESQEKRKAAEGSRRAKAAERKNKEKEAKREKKKNASKVKKSKPKETKKAGSGTTGQDSKESATDVAAAEGSEKPREKAASRDKLAAVDAQRPVTGSEPELPPLPAVEDIGDMEFSGMRGMALSSKKGRNLPPKAGAPGSKMRRLHGLLASAEEKKKRLEGLQQTEEGKEQAREEAWNDAMRVAGGESVKDNPAALKKMIKRKEKDKVKSTSQWKDRTAGVTKEQAARQSKREENLTKRKSKGGASASAPGDNAEHEQAKRQRRAGFEGKRQDFINKEKPGSSTQGGGKKSERAAGRG